MKARRVILWLTATGLTLTGIAPLLSALLASGIAAMAGCDVDAALPRPCMIWGADRGAALHQMFLAGVLVLMTIPLTVCGIVLAIMLTWGILRPELPPAR